MRIETNRLFWQSYAGACHSERSEAQSKNPAVMPCAFATGSLDFARDDVLIYPSVLLADAADRQR